MTEVTTLLHQLYVECNFTKEDFEEIVRLACMSDDDVHKEAMNRLDSTLTTVLDKVFADATSGKQEAIDALKVLTNMVLKNMGEKE